MWITTIHGTLINLDNALLLDVDERTTMDGKQIHEIAAVFLGDYASTAGTVLFEGTEDQCNERLRAIAAALKVKHVHKLSYVKKE